jgi:hypothetical protein
MARPFAEKNNAQAHASQQQQTTGNKHPIHQRYLSLSFDPQARIHVIRLPQFEKNT